MVINASGITICIRAAAEAKFSNCPPYSNQYPAGKGCCLRVACNSWTNEPKSRPSTLAVTMTRRLPFSRPTWFIPEMVSTLAISCNWIKPPFGNWIGNCAKFCAVRCSSGKRISKSKRRSPCKIWPTFWPPTLAATTSWIDFTDKPYCAASALLISTLSTGKPVVCSTLTAVAPEIFWTCCAIVCAWVFSTSISSPKTLIPTSLRTPEINSLKRSSIGCENSLLLPGIFSRNACIRVRNSSIVSFGFSHWSRGFNKITASEILGGITSVATSAVPVRAKTALTSEKFFKISFSVFSCILKDCSKPVLGERICCKAKSPSLNCGANSLPICVVNTPVKTKILTAKVTTTILNWYAQSRICWYFLFSACIQRDSFSFTSPVINNATAAGTKVTDKIIAPSNAITTVIAIGWNIFASTPVKAKMGRYTTIIMAWPNRSGLRACLAAKKTSLKRSCLVNNRPAWCWASASRRIQFSTITTAPSTIIPKSNAPRLIKLALIFCSAIPVKVNSIDNGITQAVIKAARKLPKKINRITMTKIAPSTKFFWTVLMALFTKLVRSYTVSISTPLGKVSWISLILLSTAWATVRLFSPIIIIAIPSTVSSPLYVAAPVRKSCPIATEATSATRMGRPFLTETVIFWISSTVLSIPGTRTVSCCPFSSINPAPRFSLFSCRAVWNSVSEIWSCCKRFKSGETI